MNSNEIRKAYLDFFKSKEHVEITPSPLVLENDPTTLFTSAGMQQLVPYFSGKKHSGGKRLVDSQPSFRAVDIDEIGDASHTTFFEMLGNWSLGDYFKKEEIPWLWEFLTGKLALPPEKLYITVFEGNASVSKDTESVEIWKNLGIPEEKIFYYGVDHNWWSRTGTPEQMPPDEIGGPSTEVFYRFDSIEHNPKYGKLCHPNCECGRFLEIANSVFIQYRKTKSGSLEELPQKNVDFGGGLERIAAAVADKPDVFTIDLIFPLIQKIEKETKIGYGSNPEKDRSFRIIADHVKASANLLAEGIFPSNKLQGYIIRRLIRRAMFHLHLLGAGLSGSSLSLIAEEIKDDYLKVSENWEFISEQFLGEGKKFSNALKRGLEKLRKIIETKGSLGGEEAFDLYQSEGFPLELTIEILRESKVEFSEKEKEIFESKLQEHKGLSKEKSSKIFKKV